MVQGLHPKIFADRADRQNPIVVVALILTVGLYLQVQPHSLVAISFALHWLGEIASIAAEIDGVLKNYVIQTKLVTSRSRSLAPANCALDCQTLIVAIGGWDSLLATVDRSVVKQSTLKDIIYLLSANTKNY
jgi:hypothetical protein